MSLTDRIRRLHVEIWAGQWVVFMAPETLRELTAEVGTGALGNPGDVRRFEGFVIKTDLTMRPDTLVARFEVREA